MFFLNTRHCFHISLTALLLLTPPLLAMDNSENEDQEEKILKRGFVPPKQDNKTSGEDDKINNSPFDKSFPSSSKASSFPKHEPNDIAAPIHSSSGPSPEDKIYLVEQLQTFSRSLKLVDCAILQKPLSIKRSQESQFASGRRTQELVKLEKEGDIRNGIFLLFQSISQPHRYHPIFFTYEGDEEVSWAPSSQLNPSFAQEDTKKEQHTKDRSENKKRVETEKSGKQSDQVKVTPSPLLDPLLEENEKPTDKEGSKKKKKLGKGKDKTQDNKERDKQRYSDDQDQVSKLGNIKSLKLNSKNDLNKRLAHSFYIPPDVSVDLKEALLMATDPNKLLLIFEEIDNRKLGCLFIGSLQDKWEGLWIRFEEDPMAVVSLLSGVAGRITKAALTNGASELEALTQ